jgi:hypothetical protein
MTSENTHDYDDIFCPRPPHLKYFLTNLRPKTLQYPVHTLTELQYFYEDKESEQKNENPKDKINKKLATKPKVSMMAFLKNK